MPRALQDWSRDELETVAHCLEHDLRSAGSRFSPEFTPVPPEDRLIASAPPVDAPPDFAGPGSGGFIEGGDFDPDQLPELEQRMLGYMHAALGEPAPVAIALHVDGFETMSLVFWSGPDRLEQLADLLDQVQDVVMESTAELWPLCPLHDHQDPLLLREAQDWIEWQCPETRQAIGRFGELTGA